MTRTETETLIADYVEKALADVGTEGSDPTEAYAKWFEDHTPKEVVQGFVDSLDFEERGAVLLYTTRDVLIKAITLHLLVKGIGFDALNALAGNVQVEDGPAQ